MGGYLRKSFFCNLSCGAIFGQWPAKISQQTSRRKHRTKTEVSKVESLSKTSSPPPPKMMAWKTALPFLFMNYVPINPFWKWLNWMWILGRAKHRVFLEHFFGGFCKKGPFLGSTSMGGCNFIGAKFFVFFFGLCFFIPLLDGPGRLHCFQWFFLPKWLFTTNLVSSCQV